MVAINEQEVPVQDTTTALMNPSNSFTQCISIRRFTLLERFPGFVLIVIALLVFFPLFYRGSYP